MDPARPNVVFDCNIFLQAISRANGPAAAAFRLLEEGRMIVHLSKPILREVRRTLAYPEIRQRNPHVTDEAVEAFLTRVAFRGEFHRDVPHTFKYARDPDDEPYLDLALSVQGDYLVTRDLDLLSLATAHSIEAKEFRQRCPNIKIVAPTEFLNLVDRGRAT